MAKSNTRLELTWIGKENRGIGSAIEVHRELGPGLLESTCEQCGGRPCVRGMRIRVQDVVDLFAAGLTAREILEEMPDLEEGDLKACLVYVSKLAAHPVLAA